MNTYSVIMTKVYLVSVVAKNEEHAEKLFDEFGDWDELEDCKYYRVDIEKYPELKDRFKIRTVPTIILFHNGVKDKTWRANIMLELDVTAEEIQEEIEELLSSQF